MPEYVEINLDQEAPEFRIAILFETRELGASAMALCQQLMDKFNDDFLFRLTMESFAVLEHAAAFNQAVLDAAEADLILVAGTGRMPAVFRSWFQQSFMARKAHVPGIVVDMAPVSASAAALHKYLKEMAETHHLEVISRQEGMASLKTTTSSSSFCPRGHGTPEWGINE